MRRRVLIAVAGVAFIAISLALAAALTGRSQRGLYLDILRAQARGDVPALIALLDRCDPRCVGDVKIAIAQTRGTGEVDLVRVDESDGLARVVWVRGARGVPVVQCLRLSEDREVRRVEPPLEDNEAPC